MHLLFLFLPAVALSAIDILPHLLPGQKYCFIDDLPFSVVLDGLREYYELNPDAEKPLDESSIFYTLKFFLYSAVPIDLVTVTRHEDVDHDGDIDPCFFFGNETAGQYVPLALPRTTEDMLTLVDILGFHTPLEIYTASQSEWARAEYCDGTTTGSVRREIVRAVWCYLNDIYRRRRDARREIRRSFPMPGPDNVVDLTRHLDDRSLSIFRDGMKKAVEDASTFTATFGDKYPALSEKLDNLRASSAKLWRALPLSRDSPEQIMKRFSDGFETVRPNLERIQDIGVGPYLRRAYNAHEEHRRSHDVNGTYARPSDFFMEEMARHDTTDDEEHAFFITGVPTYEGMAPGQNHVWNLEHWPSTGVIALHVLNWLFHLWSCDRTLCEPCIPYLADSIDGCVWPILELHPDIFITRWFPGFDPLNPGCTAYATDLAYLQGLWDLLFSASNPPNLAPCLIWNAYIPMFWIFVGVLILIFLTISGLVFFCCWRIQDSLTSSEVDREQDLRRLIRHQRRIRELERISDGQSQQIATTSKFLADIISRLKSLERGGERGTSDEVDILQSVFGYSSGDAWVRDLGSDMSSEGKRWMS